VPGSFRDAVKIRCHRRRTSPSTRRQSTASQSRTSCLGPFAPATAGTSNLSLVPASLSPCSPPAHPTHVGALSGRDTRPRIRPVPQGPPPEGAAVRLLGPVAFRRTGIRFLGLPAPAGAVRLPCGRPTEPGSDPIGVAMLPAREIRPGWVLSTLRGCGAPTAGAGTPAAAGRLATAHPWTWVLPPPPQAWDNGASSRVHSRSPVRSSPLPVAPGWNGSPSALPPGFTPRRYQRRMPKWGQASGTCPESRHRHQPALLSTRPLTARTFVSHTCRPIIRDPVGAGPALRCRSAATGRTTAPARLPGHHH
jgi:hypothetical protein